MIPSLFQWIDEVKCMEKKEKKEAKIKAQQEQEVRRSPRTIDIRKFYKESSSSGEEKAKVLFRLNPFTAASPSTLFISSIQATITSAVKFPVDWSLWADPPPGLVVSLFFLPVVFRLVWSVSVFHLIFQKPVKHLKSPLKHQTTVTVTEMPKRS